MVQEMVKVVQVAAVPVARLQGRGLLVCAVKRIGEPAEQFRHGEVGFRMADVSRRVDQPCGPVPSRDEIPRPQVAVQQGRTLRLDEEPVEMVEQPAGSLLVLRGEMMGRAGKLGRSLSVP